MRYVNLGRSGVKVSQICLGCMSYGVPERGPHPWSLPEDQSRPFFRRAVELGINFFDTANFYSDGTSEEFTGRLLNEYAKRDEVVIATKVFFPMRQGPNAKGLSRKAIMAELDASLKRLGTDFIDLYQIHRLDPSTPVDEILRALDDAVTSGKVLYLGASSMFAWQFARMLYLSDRHGWSRFVSMQNHLNLIYREEEREMLPLCRAEGVGVIPWSPLARGRLARPAGEQANTARTAGDKLMKTLYEAAMEGDRKVVDAVEQVAKGRGVSMAQVATAWLLGKPGVTAPIIGATKMHHLEDAVAAVELTLSAEEVTALESPYVPHAVAGHE